VGPTGQIFKHFEPFSVLIFLFYFSIGKGQKMIQTLKCNFSLNIGQKNMKPILSA